MPTYEYTCPQQHDFELFQKMSDKPRAKCPVCGRAATRKISGGAGLHFKGSGFYITDYGRDGKGPRKDASEKAEKAEKTERTEKAEKTEKSEKSEKTQKAGTATAADQPAPAKAGKAPARKAKSGE